MREKIIKGIRSPEKVPSYLGRKIWNKAYLKDGYQAFYPIYHKYLRSRNAGLYRYDGFSDIPTEGRDGIQKTFFGNLELSQHQYHNFLTYLKLCDFAHYSGSRSILEIGAGYSTAIWADYAERTGAEVTSVDGSFDLLEDWVRGTRHESKVDDYVNLIKGVSVESEKVRQFYSEPKTELGGIEVSRFASDMDRFARADGVPVSRIKKIDSLAPTRNWSAEDLVVSDGKLSFSEEFLDSYTVWTSDYEDYLSMLEDVQRTNVVDDLYEETGGWDLIWFDSGEISSVVEWDRFKDYIKPGGLAAFHDVFFPKSMKNFVVGACLLNDPDWEVLLVDDTTKQGLIIARRKQIGHK
jgi:predicted O-methyltransferase YrrM